MSKQNRLQEAEMYRVARNEILKSDDPHIWILRDGMEESLGRLMDDIDRYIDISLHMDDNPLKYLRRTFPDFVWEFHEDHGEREGARIIAKADYIWMRVFGLAVDGLITATEKGRATPRVFCYKPQKESDEKWTSQMRRLVPTIHFVTEGDDTDASTIIE